MAAGMSGVIVGINSLSESSQVEDSNSVSCSGILICPKRRIVLTSATLLTPWLWDSQDEEKAWVMEICSELHTNGGIGIWQKPSKYSVSSLLRPVVWSVIDEVVLSKTKTQTIVSKLRESLCPLRRNTTDDLFGSVKSNNVSMDKFKKYPASILGIWKFKLLDETLKIVVPGNEKWNFVEHYASPENENCIDNESTVNANLLLSSFILLEISIDEYNRGLDFFKSLNLERNMTNCTSDESGSSHHSRAPLQIKNSFNVTGYNQDKNKLKNISKEFDFQKMIDAKKDTLYSALKEIVMESSVLVKGESVSVESSLFGALNPSMFMNVRSKGRVVNITGPNGVLVLVDVHCAPGSEGGFLFKESKGKRCPAAIIIASFCWKQKDLVGFTLACSLRPLIAHLLQEFRPTLLFNKLQPSGLSDTPNPLAIAMRSVVLIKVGSLWGSGIIISQNHGLIITCSHVVCNNSKVKVKLDYPESSFVDATVLYSTPVNETLDVAVLQLPPKIVCCQALLSNQPNHELKLGREVLAIGHALFPEQTNVGVLVTGGIVSKVLWYQNKPILIQSSCAVHSGASGGALVTADTGRLIGMIVCNSKDTVSGKTYPYINLSIPLQVIIPVIWAFITSKDPAVLSKLCMKDKNVNKIWQLGKTDTAYEEMPIDEIEDSFVFLKPADTEELVRTLSSRK